MYLRGLSREGLSSETREVGLARGAAQAKSQVLAQVLGLHGRTAKEVHMPCLFFSCAGISSITLLSSVGATVPSRGGGEPSLHAAL